MAPPPAATATATSTSTSTNRRHAAAGRAGAAKTPSPSRRVDRAHEAPSTRRAPLRVVPDRNRRGLRGRLGSARQGRLLTVLSVSMVVVALLAVVVGQAVLANGQVKLHDLQHQLTMEQSAHRQAELSVAQLETPARIVGAAEGQEHMVHQSAIELPYVSLSVPLPTPKVTPAPAPPPPTNSAGAGAPEGAGTGSASASSSSSSSSTSASSSTAAATTTPTSTP